MATFGTTNVHCAVSQNCNFFLIIENCECERWYEVTKQLHQSVIEYIDHENLECKICSAKFEKKFKLKDHIILEHTKNINGEKCIVIEQQVNISGNGIISFIESDEESLVVNVSDGEAVDKILEESPRYSCVLRAVVVLKYHSLSLILFKPMKYFLMGNVTM